MQSGDIIMTILENVIYNIQKVLFVFFQYTGMKY